MNFLELCQALRRECSISGVGPVSVEDQTGEYARVVNWIRQANQELQARFFNWKFLFRQFENVTLQNDDESLSIQAPDDLNVWLQDSFIFNGCPIGVVEYSQWNRKETFLGVPFLVQMPDDSLRLYNAPSGDIVIKADYYATPQHLIANTDEPYIPEPYHWLILYRAIMMYANYDNAPELKTSALEGMQMLMPQLEASQLPGQQQGMMVNEYDFVVCPQ